MKYKKGYLNIVYKKNGQYIRKPRVHFSNWNNESLIYSKLGNKHTIDKNGRLTREWFEGKTIKKWNHKKIMLLKIQIKKFHQINLVGLTKHNWTTYNHNNIYIYQEKFLKFQQLVKKYKNEKLVVSHNDINKKNVLWDGSKIRLIDFEWSNLNSSIFDYVQFYIVENLMLIKNSQKFQDYLFMSLIYFLMWTYDAPHGKFIKKIQKKYLKLLKNHNF